MKENDAEMKYFLKITRKMIKGTDAHLGGKRERYAYGLGEIRPFAIDQKQRVCILKLRNQGEGEQFFSVEDFGMEGVSRSERVRR